MTRSAMPARRRMQSICSIEGRSFETAREHAFDLYTLLPAASREQLELMQALPAEARRMAFSEVYDALECGIEMM